MEARSRPNTRVPNARVRRAPCLSSRAPIKGLMMMTAAAMKLKARPISRRDQPNSADRGRTKELKPYTMLPA